MHAIDKAAIANRFSRAAKSYDGAAELQREVGYTLVSKSPKNTGLQVLDAGCGTGYFSQYWLGRCNQVIALDFAEGMLRQAKDKGTASHYIQGDIEHLPLPDASVDIVFSNLALQWCSNLATALKELYRVTRSGGVVLFSTLAESSLSELSEAWQQVDNGVHINAFLSVSEISNAIDTVGARRCLLQQHTHTSTYPDVISLMRDLKGIGATHLHQGRQHGLTGRQRLAALQTAYPKQNGRLMLSYHCLYGVIYVD